MKVFLQNRIVDARRARVSVFDHGFLYGDGVYETVRAYEYRVFHWAEHFKRLRQSARSLELSCPWSGRYLLENLARLLHANRSPNASVRITVSRGPGPLGLDPALCPRPTLAMLLHPERKMETLWKTGVSIGFPKVRRNHPLCLDPQIKSNNSLNTILAKMEGKAMGVFETVLLNLGGFLTEGTTSNLFFVKKAKVYTPSLSCGLLEGVTRGVVIRLARRAGYSVHERWLAFADLKKADEIFLTSTTLEIMPVVRVKTAPLTLTLSPRRGERASEASGEGSRSFIVGSGHPGPIAAHLQRLFRTAVQKELGL